MTVRSRGGVDIDGRRVVGVAEHLRDDRDLLARVEQERREGVPHVVEPLAADTGPRLRSDERRVEAAPLHRAAVRRREHVVLVAPIPAGWEQGPAAVAEAAVALVMQATREIAAGAVLVAAAILLPKTCVVTRDQAGRIASVVESVG